MAKDNITIKQVTLNRGNCTRDTDPPDLDPKFYAQISGLPQSLKFGEVLTLPAHCNVLEAAIETDKGSSTFTWK
jgi:hypothetical protein